MSNSLEVASNKISKRDKGRNLGLGLGLGFRYVLLRCCFTLFVAVLFMFLASVLLVVLAVIFNKLLISYPISVPCRCKIVSSSVDLRSSKVCELGLLNYKAKHVFYPSEKKKFRCRHDYYWASVFKVEYTDPSGQAHIAFAEAPSEALPLDCRPSFSAVWLTKDAFKVNETYDCWYTLGVFKMNIYHDEFFDCQAEHPSAAEMFKRYSILSTEIFMSWFSQKGRGRYLGWDAIGGVVAGCSTSLITIAFARILYLLKSSLRNARSTRRQPLSGYAVRLKRACFLVAYFSFVSWLAIQYGKKLGILAAFRAYT